ncbi:MAG: S8 family peptidase [Solirubrobacterales bacterium]
MDRRSAQVQGWTRAGLLVAVTVTATALVGSVGSGSASGVAQSPGAIPGQLVVGFDPEATRGEQRSAVSEAGGRIDERLPSLDAVVVTIGDPAAAREQLSNDPDVEYVEPNYVIRATIVPNDDSFDEQWGMRNTGQLDGTFGADIDATRAWNLSTGAGVSVAVVDTGIDYNHPDLDGNIWQNPADPENGSDDDNNGFVDDTRGADLVDDDSDPSDDAGHGTHVAGIIGAEGNNGFGVAGVNWNVKLMALKFLDSNGEGNTADAASAIDYAVDHGARVINASWGGPAFSQTLYSSVKRAADRGVLFVAAAGNEGENADYSPDYPAAFDLPNVISVAASDRTDTILPYSNYGSQVVDLAAPGDDIYSTVPEDTDPAGYTSFSGTSMAAPAVAGTAALYLSHFSGSTTDQARSAILNSADRLPSMAGKTATGGRLDAASAVGAQPSADSTPDRTAPSAFALLRPRNRHTTPRRALAFKWRRSKDSGGIKSYRLFVDGHLVKKVEDTDGSGGKDPKTRARVRLSAGKHVWFVKAYDYAGNSRRSRVSGHGAKSSRSLFVGKRHR